MTATVVAKALKVWKETEGGLMNFNEATAALAQARLAARNLAHQDVGTSAYRDEVARLLIAFNSLDNTGVFATLDNGTEYADPREVLDSLKAREIPRLDPAEWGDLSGRMSPEDVA